jgi:DNA anti-recombination protein RmuC
VVKAKPAPNPGNSAKEIENDKNKCRDEIRENIKKFYDENQKEFKLQSHQRPSNINKMKEEVEATINK